jgi:CheY-like chemotaxis protein
MHKNVVLVVDDDLTILELLRYQITDAIGTVCDVELATSGQEVDNVLAQIQSSQRNLKVLVTDYFLDEITGVEIIAKVLEQFPKCATVLLTGQHQRDIQNNRAVAAIPDRYFSKPWNSFELKSHLNNLMLDITNQ